MFSKTGQFLDTGTKTLSSRSAKLIFVNQFFTISTKSAWNHFNFHNISYNFIHRSSKVLQTQYVSKDKPFETCVSNNSYSIDCENGKDKLILQLLYNGQKISVTPFTEDNLSLEDLFPLNEKKNKSNLKGETRIQTQLLYWMMLMYIVIRWICRYKSFYTCGSTFFPIRIAKICWQPIITRYKHVTSTTTYRSLI